MLSGKNHYPVIGVVGKTGLLMPALLSFALLAILFSLPQPAMHVNQPFKAELLLSLFLIVFFVVMQRREASGWTAPASAIACSIAAFVFWSAASVLWGTSSSSVAHHALLWSMYLIIFLIFTGRTWPYANIRFITTTFVLVALILGILCIFDYSTVSDFVSSEGDIRIRYGKYAELLVTISPLLWAAAIYTRNRRRMVFILFTALLSWTTVMLSLSKGAFIAGILGFVIFFIGSAAFSAKSVRKRVVAFAGIWLALTIGTQIFFSFFSAVPSTTSYITGTADRTRSTTAMRIFTWSVARQMALDHWLIGVGADNFGLAFNQERVRYRETHPNDTTEEIAEDYIVERAHNEPLQVLTELGVVGLLLLSLPFVWFGFYFIRKILHVRRRVSSVLWAAASGMVAFLVSSQFSSFSFRAAQNGVAFFMVFAVAVNEVAKASRKTQTKWSFSFSRPVYLLSWVVILLVTTYCAAKGFAEYQVYRAERSKIYNTARDHFRAAVTAEPEYAGAYLSHAARAAAVGDPATAAQMTQKAIANGLGISPVYSQLAQLQIAAGNVADAEAAYLEALSIYPRSVYMRTEFVVFLEDHGRSEAAAEQSAITNSIDPRQAKGWYLIIREGSVAAFYRSQKDPSIAPPVELVPSSAVRKYLDKVPATESVEPKS